MAIKHRVNLMLLDAIPDAGLRCTLSTRGGQNVSQEVAFGIWEWGKV